MNGRGMSGGGRGSGRVSGGVVNRAVCRLDVVFCVFSCVSGVSGV